MEIFVNDSNARRTLQVGSEYLLGSNALTQGAGRIFETHARSAPYWEEVSTEGRRS